MTPVLSAQRDLKPQNLLLTSQAPDAVLKIADFGFARPLQPQGLAETLCGSPLYMAPEILSFNKYDAKADLWSVGTILFELITGRPPFNGNNHVHLLRNIEASDAKLPPAIGAQLSPAALDMIHKVRAWQQRQAVWLVCLEAGMVHGLPGAGTLASPGPCLAACLRPVSFHGASKMVVQTGWSSRPATGVHWVAL